jgi:hypothetical protein
VDPHTEHSEDLSSKFENFEHTPADHVWRRVQIEMEGDARPGALAGHLGAYTHAPSPQVWDRIASEVSPLQRRAAIFWWVATAASVALLLFVGWRFAANKPSDSVQNQNNWSAHIPVDSAQKSSSGSRNSNDFSEGRNRNANSAFSNDIRHRSLSEQGLSSLLFASVDDGSDLQTPENNPNQPEMSPMQRRLLLANEKHLYRRDIIVLPDFTEPSEDLPADFEQWAKINSQQDEEPALYAAALNSSFSQSVSLRKSFSSPSQDNSDPFTGLGVQNESLGEFARLDENFTTPIIIGIQMRRGMSKRISLGAGPVYTLMASTETFTSSSKIVQQNRRRQYLGLALNGNYEFIQRRRFAAYGSAGIQFDLGLSYRNRIVTTETGGITGDQIERSGLGNQALANLGAGIDYHLTEVFGLYLQGSVQHAFYRTHANLWTQRPLWPGLQVGLRVNL